MQFATLFLIASAVLALPTGDRADNIAELAKKDAAPAGGLLYPTEEQDNPFSDEYRFKDNFNYKGDTAQNSKPEQNNKPEQNSKPEQNQPAQTPEDDNPFLKFTDNNKTPCIELMNNELVDIPVECMKPIFCNDDYPANKSLFCLKTKIDKDNWTKDDIVNKVRSHDCVRDAICKPEDIYNKHN